MNRFELIRIFKSKSALIAMIIIILSPIIGYTLYKPATTTLSDKIILNPLLSVTIIGSFVFAVLTISEYSKADKYNTDKLINATVSPIVIYIERLCSIIFLCIVIVLITSLIYYPYIVYKMKGLFCMSVYLKVIFILCIPSIILSVLISSLGYNLFTNKGACFILYLIFYVPQFIEFPINTSNVYWLKPLLPTLSDNFSNDMFFRLLITNRIIYFCMIIGIWMISLLLFRKFKGHLIMSFKYNIKKFYFPIIGVALICCGVYTYFNQVYVSREDDMEKDFCSDDIEDNENIQLKNIKSYIKFNTSKGSIIATSLYTLENLSGEEQTIKLRKNKGLSIKKISINDDKYNFKNIKDKNLGGIDIVCPISKNIEISIEYEIIPKVEEKISGLLTLTQVVSEKEINLISSIFPKLYVDRKDYCTDVNMEILKNLNPVVYSLVSQENDIQLECSKEGQNNNLWNIKSKGSFCINACEYNKNILGDEECPIEMYYTGTNLGDSIGDSIENTVNYCINHYGKLYNSDKDNPLKVVELSAYTKSGVGLSNYSTFMEGTISTKDYDDESIETEYEELLIHELIHQWFGFKNVSDRDDEGIVQYIVYRIMREKYGQDFAEKHFIHNWKEQKDDYYNDFYVTNKEYLERLPEKYKSQIEQENDVSYNYIVVPLKLVKISQIIGEDKLDEALKNLYEKSQAVPISWQDLLDECNVSNEDVDVK